MILDRFTPSDLALPSKFRAFRREQKEMAEFVLRNPSVVTKRFVGIGAPPGVGKSLLAHTVGVLSGVKYAVLTATRALETQNVNDGFDCVNIRGRANYPCASGPYSCEEGYGDEECPLAGKAGCTYRQRVERARAADAVLTNYQYWIQVRSRNRSALETEESPIELLILDEAHLAEQELSRALNCFIGFDQLHRYTQGEHRTVLQSSGGAEWGRLTPEWVAVLERAAIRISTRMSEILERFENETACRRRSREYRSLEKLSGSIERVVSHGLDPTSVGPNWVWQIVKGGVSFQCVWSGRYAEQYLYTGVPRVLDLSASLRPKAMELGGMPAAESVFREWPRVFPTALNPVVWVPTGGMGRKAGAEEVEEAYRRADEIYDEWAPRHKGMVYTASYPRAEALRERSKWGHHMILNKRGEDAAQVADRFRKASAPAILVSPSYGTGYDFPDEECRWVHVFKLPFPDRSDPVVVARCESDPRWYDYATIQQLVQICGRGSRHEKDRCVYIVTDDAVQRLRGRAAWGAPRWFEVRDAEAIPRAESIATAFAKSAKSI